MIIYGINNCDTVKRARVWATAKGIDHTFHDFRKDGLSREQLQVWCDDLGWEVLLNRRGTTWRKLPEADKENLDAVRAVDLMLAHPAMIKRPVFDLGTRTIVGFGKSEQAILENAY